MSRKLLSTVAAGVIAAAAVLIAGCGGSSGGSSGSSAGEVLRIGTNQQFLDPNPFNAYPPIDFGVANLEYPVLVQYDAAGKVVPDFATSWTHSADGKTYTFTTRSNAHWSDGQPLTAADVAWSLNTTIKYQKGGTSINSENVQFLKNVTDPNPTTVILHYSIPQAPAGVYSLMNLTWILPEHIWASHTGGPDGADLKTFKNQFPSVAGGPFIPTSWNGTTFLLMKRNPYYYGPKPSFSEVGIEYYTTPDALLQALKSKQIDYATGLPQSDTNLVKTYPNVVVKSYPQVEYYTLWVNDAPAAPHKELLNPLVRRAIDVSLNRQQMVNIAFPGSQVGESIVPPAVNGEIAGTWWNSNVAPTYDPALANQLLDKAGYKMGPNGVRIANGHPMSYTLYTDTENGGAGDRIFQITQADLKAIGISVSQKAVDPTAWFKAVMGTNNTYNQFDMAEDIFASLLDPNFNLLYYTCGDIGSFNNTGFCSKAYDDMYALQSSTLNTQKRQQLVNQMQVMAQKAEAVPSVLLYTLTVDAWQNDWTGFGGGPYGSLSDLSKLVFTSIHHI
jgi:peptide/nickel transport system substrate-binding protein